MVLARLFRMEELHFCVFKRTKTRDCRAEKEGVMDENSVSCKGCPFFSVGGQVNNSTPYSAEKVETVFSHVKDFGLNTVAAPVYWELLEPEEGHYDFAQTDMLMQAARRHGLRLVLLWFGTWKNGNSHYIPRWMKLNGKRFPMAKSADGVPVCSLSPHFAATQKADRAAFCALCTHIAQNNADETVIGIQVENEPGLMGTPRDYGAEAEERFRQTVPDAVAEFAGRSGTWEEVFGEDAAECFTVWSVAVYIDEIVRAGKECLCLPMYTNVWLGEMHNRVPGVDYPSGGAVSKLLPLFRKGASHLDAVSPDIYLQDQATWNVLNRAYGNDQPYYIPELLPGALSVTRAIQAVAENELCGVHFFAADAFCQGAGGGVPEHFAEALQGLQTLARMAPLIQRCQGSGKLYAVTQYEGMSEQYIDFGDYIGIIRFSSSFGDLMAKPALSIRDIDHFFFSDAQQRGKGLICYEGNGRFYLAGNSFRLVLLPKGGVERATATARSGDFLNTRSQAFLSVTQGTFDETGTYRIQVRRNGDEMDNGIWVTPDCGVVCAEMNTTFFDC